MVETETDMCFQQFFSELLLFQQQTMEKYEKYIFKNFVKSFMYIWATFSYELEFLWHQASGNKTNGKILNWYMSVPRK